MQNLAEKVSEDTDESTDALLERWRGRPDLVAEDIFQARNMETGEMEDLEFFRPYQPRLVHAYFYGDEEIINVYKGRRIGVSFTFVVCVILEALFKPDTFYPIVSKTKSQSKARIADAKELIKNAKVDFDLPTDNKDEIVFGNGSRLKAYTGDPDSGRGDDSAKTVFVDEMAFLEDQHETMQTFMPFISLGDAKMLQVSTPKVSNDLFLENHERGSEAGRDGVISIKQPSFKNAEDIDPEVSLREQDVTPVRPDMNINTVETERAQDPQGFAQEYLCRPVSDEYRFFSMDTIRDAQEKGSSSDYSYGLTDYSGNPGQLIMGVDIGFNSDETALSVFEHHGEYRMLRYQEIINDETLARGGITPTSRQNPQAVAKRISQVHQIMGVNNVVMDMTGVGQGFHDEVRRKIGRGYTGFNFSDKDAVEEMMGDFNYALHNGKLSLIEGEKLRKQLGAIVKKQSHEYQKPKFSGKQHAPEGRDDLAMATIMGAFPPNFSAERSRSLQQRDEVSPSMSSNSEEEDDTEPWRGLEVTSSSRTNSGYSISNSGRESGYKSRHKRRSSRRRF
jgi:phage FluMu gp28-like protein